MIFPIRQASRNSLRHAQLTGTIAQVAAMDSIRAVTKETGLSREKLFPFARDYLIFEGNKVGNKPAKIRNSSNLSHSIYSFSLTPPPPALFLSPSLSPRYPIVLSMHLQRPPKCYIILGKMMKDL